MRKKKKDNLEEMLFAYELGMLSDEECEKFEMQLLEDYRLFEKAQKFQKVAELLRSNPTFPMLAKKFASNGTTDIDRSLTLHRYKKLWHRLLPATIIIVIIIIFVLNPFQVEFKLPQEVNAALNRLVILNFENITNPDDSLHIGEMISNLLITDLTESEYINVISPQQLHDIAVQEGRESSLELTERHALDAASVARAKWIVIGNIMEVDTQLVITSNIVEVIKGERIASQKVRGNSSNIFDLVDSLSYKIKRDLPLPSDAFGEFDPLVGNVTTHSSRAYLNYIKGLENYHKLYYKEAIENFNQALKEDSTMAMAYYYLSLVKRFDFIEKAYEFIENVNKKERLRIQIRYAQYKDDFDRARQLLEEYVFKYPDDKYAHYLLGGYYVNSGLNEEAENHLKLAIELDPNYKIAYNKLAYFYNSLGDYEKSLWAINKYLEIAPNEANPYDTRGEIYARYGYLDKAILSYTTAIEIKPDYHTSRAYLGILEIFNRNYSVADSHLVILNKVDNPRIRSASRLYRAYIPIYKGKFLRAIELLDSMVHADHRDFGDSIRFSSQYRKNLLKADVHLLLKQYDMALQELEHAKTSIELSHRSMDMNIFCQMVRILAESGNMAEAEEITGDLRLIIESEKKSMSYHDLALGYITFYKKEFDKAIEYFLKAGPVQGNVKYRYMLGLAYLESSKLDKSAEQFEILLGSYTSQRAYDGIWSVLSHYHLGRCYEISGWHDKAIEQYRLFFQLWKDADPCIPEIKDVESKLKSS